MTYLITLAGPDEPTADNQQVFNVKPLLDIFAKAGGVVDKDSKSWTISDAGYAKLIASVSAWSGWMRSAWAQAEKVHG
jgi:hypothetical protein